MQNLLSKLKVIPSTAMYRLAIFLFSAILCGLFFLPLVNVFTDYNENTYTGLNFVTGLDYVFYGSYPIVLMLLVLPAVLLLMSLTKISFGHLLKVAIVAILGITWFNVHFVHGIDYRRAVDATPFYWAAVILYAVIILLIFAGILVNGEIKLSQNIIPPYSNVQRKIICGVLLGVAFTVSLMTTIVIPIGGAPILRFGFSGVFHNIVAIFFGPFFGGLQRAMADLLNFFFNPRITGAFLLPVTLVAFFRGFAIGYMWLKVKNINPKIFSVVYSACFGFLLVLGIVNVLILLFFPDTAYANWLTPYGTDGVTPNLMVRNVLSYGLIIAGLLGLVPHIAAYILTRKSKNSKFHNRFIKLLVSIVLPGIVANAINTYILLLMVIGPLTRELGFIYFWIPRFFEEITTSLLATYLLVILLEVYEKAMRRKLEENPTAPKMDPPYGKEETK